MAVASPPPMHNAAMPRFRFRASRCPLIGLRGGLAEIAHRAAGLIGVFQPVHHHVVDDPVMTARKGRPGARLFLRNCVPAANPGWSDDRGTGGVRKPPRHSLYVGRISANDPCVFSNARIVEPIGC
jgi:hypothetical protein